MKKVSFIILLIISTISVVFAYSTLASEISYNLSGSKWSTSNIQESTDSLYYDFKRRPSIGQIVGYMGTVVPDNFLECDGSILNISDYPHLAEHFEDEFGSSNYFGGDGSMTFALPDLRGEFLRGSTSTVSPGTHQDASLPNIKGRLVPNLNATSTIRILGGGGGAITISGSSGKHAYVSAINGSYNVANSDLVFDASRYSSVYQNGAEARPTNTSVLYVIRYK